MNNALTQEELEKILNQAVQDITERTAGVRLHQGEQSPGEDLCTVHITFDRGFQTSLTLCADTSLLYRMACNSFHEELLEPEDLEEFSKEYFNVLCGRIASAMFQATQVPAHFNPPVFYHGRYEPEGREIQFVLTYSNEYNEGAQLIHHVPRQEKEAANEGSQSARHVCQEEQDANEGTQQAASHVPCQEQQDANEGTQQAASHVPCQEQQDANKGAQQPAGYMPCQGEQDAEEDAQSAGHVSCREKEDAAVDETDRREQIG